jgi:hypothetical protein
MRGSRNTSSREKSQSRKIAPVKKQAPVREKVPGPKNIQKEEGCHDSEALDSAPKAGDNADPQKTSLKDDNSKEEQVLGSERTLTRSILSRCR